MDTDRINTLLGLIQEHEEDDMEGTTREERLWMENFKTLAESVLLERELKSFYKRQPRVGERLHQ